MTILTRSIIDSSSVSSLDIYANGNLETAYSFHSGQFTLTERPNAVSLSSVDLFSNIAYIRDWYECLKQTVGIETDNCLQCSQKRDFRLETTIAEIDLRFFYPSEIVAIDARYDKNDNKHTVFQPRSELLLSTGQFSYFINSLEYLVNKIKWIET